MLTQVFSILHHKLSDLTVAGAVLLSAPEYKSPFSTLVCARMFLCNSFRKCVKSGVCMDILLQLFSKRYQMQCGSTCPFTNDIKCKGLPYFSPFYNTPWAPILVEYLDSKSQPSLPYHHSSCNTCALAPTPGSVAQVSCIRRLECQILIFFLSDSEIST